MLKLYNTLTKTEEEFKPLNEGKVTMYVCGPTVYDFFHIGNARSFINADFIRRYLEFLGYDVKFVMNITDIDDKIINRSLGENRPASEVAGEYAAAFLEDLHRLNIKPATVYPKATEHITEIIELIQKLEKNGVAYARNGDVYFEIEKFAEYGKLSGKKLDELDPGSRVEVDEMKKAPLDFALWKHAKPGEPYWESPWGKGRPGWHIECSAMSCKHLGETFDIHAGGNDLIFPHHENEIAQSEAATGKPFVRYWLHFGFLNIDNEKMSKSLGNFKTARDILKHYSAETIRYFFAQSHYRAPLNFTDEALNSAKAGLEKLQSLYDRVTTLSASAGGTAVVEFPFDKYYDNFRDAMDADINTSRGLAVVFEFVKEANRILSTGEKYQQSFYAGLKEFLDRTAAGVFGIISDKKVSSAGIEEKLIGLLIDVRNEARKTKNFALSDMIRDGLKNLGVTLQDSKDGTTYKIG